MKNFNETHPELQEGELFYMNMRENENHFLRQDTILESSCIGEIAYNNQGKVVPGYKPMFVKLKPLNNE